MYCTYLINIACDEVMMYVYALFLCGLVYSLILPLIDNRCAI